MLVFAAAVLRVSCVVRTQFKVSWREAGKGRNEIRVFQVKALTSS